MKHRCRKLFTKIIILCGIISPILAGITWLGLLFFISYLFYIAIKLSKFDILLKRREILMSLIILGAAFSFAVFLKLAFINIYRIPSSSMEDIIYEGDYIIVNKLAYGPAIPRSGFEIPWFNVLWGYCQKNKKAVDKKAWPYYRLSGYTNIKQNDIIVFKSPWDINFFIVKRCIGMPGDILEISNSKVYCKNKHVKNAISTKNSYKVYFNNMQVFQTLENNYLDSWVQKKHKNDTIKYLIINANIATTNKLEQSSYIDSIVNNIHKYDTTIHLYPDNKLFKWSIDNYGPLLVPQKGSRIKINDTTYALYNDIIKKFEEIDLDYHENIYYASGKPIREYQFKNNYYFMMGDNRHQSSDSRMWGLVPECNIIGRADLVLFSYIDSFEYGRFFKEIE